MIIPILQSRSSSLERISDLSKVTQRAGDRDGFRALEGALKNISLSLFFIAFKNKPQLLNIIIPIIDFQLEPLPEMLNDKYSYYQREHSEKLIASICLMSVCVHTHVWGGERFGMQLQTGRFLCNTERSQEIVGTQIWIFRTAWHPQQRIQGWYKSQEHPSCLRDALHELPRVFEGET